LIFLTGLFLFICLVFAYSSYIETRTQSYNEQMFSVRKTIHEHRIHMDGDDIDSYLFYEKQFRNLDILSDFTGRYSPHFDFYKQQRIIWRKCP
jgi:hypothetical protein